LKECGTRNLNDEAAAAAEEVVVIIGVLKLVCFGFSCLLKKQRTLYLLLFSFVILSMFVP
jgi:hypothetical protein